MLRKLSAAALSTVLVLSAAPVQAASEGGIQVGVLSCNVASGWGFVFGSSRDVHCVFHPAKGHDERYAGHISKFGVDIGYTNGGVIVWGVFAPTGDMSPGALEGTYAGGTASATLGVGAGVHALIGGFKSSFTLQPVSIEGNAGLNVAAGIAAVGLKYRGLD